MATFLDENDCTWNEMLPSNPMFDRLRKKDSAPVINGNILCEIRGDLFVWNDAEKVLLTTNLKRLMAYHTRDDQVYQILHLSKQPESSVVRMLPDGNGTHIALQCQKELIVVRLFHLRGARGEFGGGNEGVICKSIQVASDFFKVHYDFIKLLQVEWHPDTSGVLIFLTSDNVLRLVNLANPGFPFLTIPLLSGSASEISLKDPMVNFTLFSNTVFVLQDNGDVFKVPLVSKATFPSALGMHPPAEDNYGSDATSLLVLPTNPPALIIANGNGVLHHCVYLDSGEAMDDDEDKQQQHPPGYPTEMLYVVETIELTKSESSTSSEAFKLTLLPDPVDIHTYYVIHIDGVYIVTLSWLSKLDMFTAADFRGDAAKSSLTHLLATEPEVCNIQGLAVVCEPLLGFTLIGLTSDWECLTMPLPRSEKVAPVAMDDIGKVMRHRQQADRHSSEFEKTIHDTLNPSSEDQGIFPIIRSYISKQQMSQQECYQFLASTIKHLHNRHLLQQRKALAIMKDKVERLSLQKQQVISELVRLKDEAEELREKTNDIEYKLDSLMKKQKLLMKSVEQIVYRVESKSPHLSEAEELMKTELEGLQKHIKVMSQKLIEARRKFALCSDISGCSPKIDLSAQQSATILRTLTDSGTGIKNMMQTVRGLRAITPS